LRTTHVAIFSTLFQRGNSLFKFRKPRIDLSPRHSGQDADCQSSELFDALAKFCKPAVHPVF